MQFEFLSTIVGLLDDEWKADLIMRKDRPFSREEFARRQPAAEG